MIAAGTLLGMLGLALMAGSIAYRQVRPTAAMTGLSESALLLAGPTVFRVQSNQVLRSSS